MTDLQNNNRSRVTRQNRAINDEEWIEQFLNDSPQGMIATTQGEQPYLSTLLFALDPAQKVIYFHTARRGRVWDNLQQNRRVCFTATEMGRLLPADTALNFSVEYQSVVAFGNADLVEDPVEAERALQMILDKYFPHLQPGKDYRPITEGELSITAVFRLEVEEWSGKRKAVAETFPGAFRWENLPS